MCCKPHYILRWYNLCYSIVFEKPLAFKNFTLILACDSCDLVTSLAFKALLLVHNFALHVLFVILVGKWVTVLYMFYICATYFKMKVCSINVFHSYMRCEPTFYLLDFDPKFSVLNTKFTYWFIVLSAAIIILMAFQYF